MKPEQQSLDLGMIRVHCFTCPTVVEAADPDTAHDAMEAHYRAEHQRLIDRLTGALR